ncbi:MAG: CbtA family protein [Tistlia sp.]|uniref:CbtA family protein n=1 Tax=Tistlia sp. TaxID=3057121 RepID=UPI0034A47679
MLRRILLTALAAGLIAGVLVTAVQSVTTTPIILHAEQYESAAEPHDHSGLDAPAAPLADLAEALLPSARAHSDASRDAGHESAEGSSWAPGDGLERLFYTLSANLLLGVGFALLIVAGFVLHGREVTTLSGILWGGAGFVVVTLAPGLGLPPEVPGSLAADLQARQLWWLFAAVAAAVGLGLVVFAARWPAKALGVAVAALPHLLGAPQPEALGGNVPPELAGHFAAASIVVSAIFWALLGWLSATFYRRLS